MSKERFKTRLNVSLTPRINRAGHKLAKSQNRSFSNFLECLIVQEDARLKPQNGKAQLA
jgi:hypothetical protein